MAVTPPPRPPNPVPGTITVPGTPPPTRPAVPPDFDPAPPAAPWPPHQTRPDPPGTVDIHQPPPRHPPPVVSKPKAKPGAPTNPLAVNPAGFTQVQQFLSQYGLGSLSGWALKEMQKGASADQVALDMRQTKQWQDRFWMITARQKAGLPPISEAEVISYEDTARQEANLYGLPKGFLDQHTIGQWIADDKSASELDTILKNGYDAVAKADPLVRQYFANTFGANSDGALAAFFIDPEKSTPLLLQQAQSAILGGNAKRYGIDMTAADTMQMAQAGVTLDRAETGFQNVDRLASIFQTEIGDTGPQLSKAQGVEASVLGNAPEIAAEQAKLSARVAGAKGKVGVEENPTKGFEGLGAAF